MKFIWVFLYFFGKGVWDLEEIGIGYLFFNIGSFLVFYVENKVDGGLRGAFLFVWRKVGE